MPETISNKQQMYTHLRAGKFGNHFPMFHSLEEAEDSGGWVGIRYAGEKVGQVCIPRILARDLRATVASLITTKHLVPERMVFVAVMPEEDIVLQGELQEGSFFLDLTYSTYHAPMREAFQHDQRHASGLVAYLMLQTYMDPSSYDDIMQLLNDYPGCVIEFTTYQRDAGCCPRRNTVVWEVRQTY